MPEPKPTTATQLATTLPPDLDKQLDILLIDNFDSFSYNLYQSLCLVKPDIAVTVIRNDAIPASLIPLLKIKYLVISPGPGHPHTDSGISRDAIKHFTGKVPILGVCMGLECLVDVFGGDIAYAGEIMHGKVSPIRHDGRGIFKSIPQLFKSTRYHSLSASSTTLPSTLAITATTAESGVIMAVRHRECTLEAVQYHPESILSEQGAEVLANFLTLKGGKWIDNPECGVLDGALPEFDLGALKMNGNGKNGTHDGADGVAAQKLAAKVPSILEKIYAQRLTDVTLAKQTPGTTPSDLSTLLALHLAPPPIPLVARLKSSKGTALMAEIKRASPSKGAIALGTNAAEQALIYALSGASVISVLTEPNWFKGSLLDMRLAREAISTLPNRPAILRKDFILDEYQIAEARLHGADTVLLIVAMLPASRLRTLYAYSLGLGMEPLVEVNNAREMALALELGAQVIGVNNRNLHDFEVDMGTTSRLVDMVGGRGVVLCALSGIVGPADVRVYREQGVGAVLVGEALMRAKDPKTFIRELLDWPAEPEIKEEEEDLKPFVKICGVTSVEDAIEVANAGADMIGLNFVPSSKRVITLETAQIISSAFRSRPLPTPPSDATAFHPTIEDELPNQTWFTAHAKRVSRTLLNASKHPLLVGVFQNQPLSYVLHVTSVVQLDFVQLHGSEPLEWAKHIPVPVIRVFHTDNDGNGLEGLTRGGLHQFVLVDSIRDGRETPVVDEVHSEVNGNGDRDGKEDGGVEIEVLSGGSGKIVDWNIAAEVVQAGEIVGKRAAPTNGEASPSPSLNAIKPISPGPMPIFLAGGLTPENVGEAVEKVRPWAVDVSGGVENAGVLGKDIEKVKAFIIAAKGL